MARMQIEAVYRGERSLFELTPIDRAWLEQLGQSSLLPRNLLISVQPEHNK